MSEKDRRLFAPFPIEMDEHPKIIGLSDAAFRAFIESTFYARRMLTDGFLDERVVLRRWGQGVADELSNNDPERPSWVRVERGWRIHDFEKHHPLRAEIEAKSADLSQKRADAGRKGMAKRWQTGNTETLPDSKRITTDSKRVTKHNSETQTETETSVSSNELTQARVTFDDVWSDWPKKTEKHRAQTEYAKAVREHPGVADDIRRFGAAYAQTTETRYVPSLAAWLHRKRWHDELPARQVAPVGGRQTAGERARAIADEFRRAGL